MLPPVTAYRSQTTLQNFPLVTGLSSRTSAMPWDNVILFGSPQVIRRCKSSRPRTCQDCGHRPSPTDPMKHLATGAAEISRFSNIELTHMHRVFDSVDQQRLAICRHCPWCLPYTCTWSALQTVISELNTWPMLSPSTLHVHSRDCPRMTRGHDEVAPSFMWGYFTPYSTTVYPGAFTSSP